MDEHSRRPVFLDLTRIHFPVTAVLSIGHRIAGVALFLAVPFAAWLLQRSLGGPAEYHAAAEFLNGGPVRVLSILLLWLAAHHFYAGLRYLLIDLDLGVGARAARRSAWAVIAAALATLFLGVWIW